MRASVGKPTLVSGEPRALGDLSAIDLAAGRKADDLAGQREGMAGADHRRQRFLAVLVVARRRRGEGPEPPPFGESQRGGQRFAIGVVAGGFAVGLLDAGRAQLVDQPPLAVAAAAQRLRLGQCVGGIVDIALACEPRRNALEIGFEFAAPTPLPDFAGEVGSKFGAGRREALDIAQSQLLEPGRIERGTLPLLSLRCHDAVFVPHSLAKGKACPGAAARRINRLGRNGVLERNASMKTELAPPGATPTIDTLERRLADFETLGGALDYAAQGRRGLNFHDARGTLTRAYP